MSDFALKVENALLVLKSIFGDRFFCYSSGSSEETNDDDEEKERISYVGDFVVHGVRGGMIRKLMVRTQTLEGLRGSRLLEPARETPTK